MIRNLVLIFNVAALLIYKILFQDGGVEIKQTVPQTVKAGSDYTVELTVSKGAVSGFAKFQQELPAGMTATAIETKSGTFSFTDQNVKIIWMSLPTEKEFTISYKVSVSKDMSGPTSLAGKFSYIDNNEKRTVNVNPSTIDVENPNKATTSTQTPAETQPVATQPQETTAPQTTTPAATGTADQPAPATGTGTSGLSCTRNILTITNPDEFTVELVVNRGAVSGFAKLEETLPTGFTASVIEPMNAVFSFVDQKAKFLWMSLPTDNQFKISYKVKRDPSAPTQLTVEGLFSYLENDVTQKVTIPAQNVNLAPGAVASTQKTTAPAETTATTTPVVTPVETQPEVVQQQPKEQPQPTETAKETKPEPSVTPTTQESTAVAGNGAKVKYKVQIMAAHKPVSESYFKNNHMINESVASEMHEGWHKFTIGSFSDYRQARDKRESVSQNKLPGPFVTAYNGGKRITVQEALMISAQKWVK